jgi:hypothetical protein
MVVRDRRRGERREQRDVHRAEPPDPQHGDQELAALAHQGGDPVARPDPEPGQCGRETLRVLAQLAVGQLH